MPTLPDQYLVRFTQTRHGRARSRMLGERRDAPPVVAVMGMAVADFLLLAGCRRPAAGCPHWTLERHTGGRPGELP